MQNKSVVRKRVVRISAKRPLTSGTDVTAGEAVIGSVGSVDGAQALAMVRLDRAAEAADKGQPLAAGGVEVTIDAAAVQAWRDAMRNRPVIDL